MFAYLVILATLSLIAIIVTIKLSHPMVLYFAFVEIIILFGIINFLVTGEWI